MGLGTTELMTKGYIPEAPCSSGSSCILALFSNGSPTSSPGFQSGFGLLTSLTLSGSLQDDIPSRPQFKIVTHVFSLTVTYVLSDYNKQVHTEDVSIALQLLAMLLACTASVQQRLPRAKQVQTCYDVFLTKDRIVASVAERSLLLLPALPQQYQKPSPAVYSPTTANLARFSPDRGLTRGWAAFMPKAQAGRSGTCLHVRRWQRSLSSTGTCKQTSDSGPEEE